MITILDVITLLQAPFIQRAFIIALTIALLSSILSIFIVLKKISLIGDGLSHTAFGGLSLGYFITTVLFGGVASFSYYAGVVPQWTAAIIVILGSIGINKALRSTKISGDAAVAVFLQLGLAGGIVLLSISHGFGVNLESLLFGSILIVNTQQIITAAIVVAIGLAIIFLVFKELVYTTFDETQARAAGIRTWVYDYLLSGLAGVAVVIAIPIVGVLLMSALLVLPALISTQVAQSFRQTVILSPIVGSITVLLGILLAVVIDAAPGGTIVLTGLAILSIVFISKKIGNSLKKQSRS
ncbi:MAG TPA: metal ABC transporter permease [Candidatus Nanoarchaeia archaeon]|nr:metal ABC transporter permease [Candidatus Nanoarchaeia archaeon]